MNALLPPVENLRIDTLPLEQVTLYALQTRLSEFYSRTLIRPEYALLSKEDYEEITQEALALGHFWFDCNGNRIISPRIESPGLKKAFGMYVASLPDLSREAEYTRAHLTFARHGYQELPTLERGEVLIIFPC